MRDSKKERENKIKCTFSRIKEPKPNSTDDRNVTGKAYLKI